VVRDVAKRVNEETLELLSFIRLIGDISADLHGAESNAAVFEAVTRGFRGSKGLSVHIMCYDERNDDLRFVGTSFAPAIVKLGELIAGVSIDSYRFGLDDAPLMSRVVRDEETLLVSTMDALSGIVPKAIVPTILQRLGYEGTEDILTPLYSRGRVVGVLSITAPQLAEYFAPSARSLAHHIGAALDVVALRESQRETEQQYRNLIENLDEIIFTLNADGRITYVSTAARDYGLPPDELVGRSYGDVLKGDDARDVTVTFRAMLDGEKTTLQGEYRLRDGHGVERWLRISARTVLSNGTCTGVSGSIIDITDAKTMELALRQNRKILDETGRMARIGGWDHDLRTGEARWTNSLFAILEMDASTLPPDAQEHWKFYPPADREALRSAYGESAKTGNAFDLELQGFTGAGALKWFRVHGEPVMEDGVCIRMAGTFQDIDREKRGELARAESERQLSVLMGNLPGMVYRCRNEPDWPMEFVSDGCLDLTGYPAERLTGGDTPYAHLISAEDRARVWEDVQRACEDGRPFVLEYRIVTADGETKWVREQGQGIVTEGGSVTVLEGFVADVTGQHAAEAALRRNEERLTLALEATSDALWDWSVDTNTRYFSPRFFAMLGYDPATPGQSSDLWETNSHPEDRVLASRAIRAHIADSDERFEAEFRMRAADGSWRWMLARGRVVGRGEDGRPIRVVGTCTDDTARKKDAETIKRALDGTIHALTRMSEERDPYTAGHQERVASLACALADEMGVDEALRATLRIAGWLHDVGKTAVPSEILSKPSRLTETEMRIVQLHPEASHRILQGIEFPPEVAEMALQHHERLDGTGYPQGLKGDEICLGARILAVADVFEAMASHRPHRPSLGIDRALAEIETGRGTAFDEHVVDACRRLFRERGMTIEDLLETYGGDEPAAQDASP